MTRRIFLLPTLIVVGLACRSTPSMGPAAERGEPGPSDLSVCTKDTRRVPPTDEVDLEDFARRLHGTWELDPRTVQGVIIDAHADYYFDFTSISDVAAKGSAALFDHGILTDMDPQGVCELCNEEAAVGAYWDVEIRKEEDPRLLTLIMKGEYLGSFADFREGITATETMTFTRFGDRYLASYLVTPAGGQGMPDEVWERIGLTGDYFTFVFCGRRSIDRYRKVSAERPRVGGLDLKNAWVEKKASGQLLNPSPLHPDTDHPERNRSRADR